MNNNIFNNPQQLEQARFFMIEQQIRPWNVFNHHILELLATHKREQYVPAQHINLSFVDSYIDVGDGQVMLEPKMEARIIQDASVQINEKVLLIGAASGYMAALLSSLAQQVTAVEINPRLAKIAQKNLATNNINDVKVIIADASNTPITGELFDVIILSGSIAKIPEILWQQIKIGGRIVGIVGNKPIMRMCIATKVADQQYDLKYPWDANAPRLLNFPEDSAFEFI